MQQNSDDLCNACKAGDLQQVQYWIDQKVDVNKADERFDWTPLQYAVKEEHLQIIKLLLEAGADVNKGDHTALHRAVNWENLEIVKLLIEYNADVNKAAIDFQYDGWTPLHFAAWKGNFKIAKLLIEHNADVNKANNLGFAPLYTAAAEGFLNVAKLLIEHNADVNQTIEKYDWTPLYWAAAEGHLEAAQLLIKYGADVNKTNKNGSTPINAAVQNDSLPLVKLLLDSGANINQTTDDGTTIFYYTAEKGRFKMLELLLNFGADVNQTRVEDGTTPLWIASQKGHLEIVKLLILNKAEVNQTGINTGTTPLSEAAKNGNLAIVKLLLEQNADKDLVDKLGYTASTWAILFGNIDIVKLLSKFNFSVVSRPMIEKSIEGDSIRGYKGENEKQVTAPETIDQALLEKANITLEYKLGSGNFGDVWRGIYDGMPVAVKFLYKASEQALGEIVEELSLLGAIKHTNVIQYLKFFDEAPAIIMELAENGNLNSFLKQQQQPIDWPLRLNWSIQLSNALIYLHQRGIIHRDLRCVNILLTKEWDVKISDFGVSVWFDENGNTKKKPHYIAKDVYSIDEEDTLNFEFDLKLFAIVLVKLLLFGEEVDSSDFYAWKQKNIDTSHLKCDLLSYLDLIQKCYSGEMNSVVTAAFVRSIYVHKLAFTVDTGIAKRFVDVEMTLKELGTSGNANNTLATLFEYELNDKQLIEALIQYARKKETSQQAIALLGTMSPQKLNAWLSMPSLSHDQRTVRVSELTEIAQIIQESKSSEQILDAINQLAAVNKDDGAAELLIKCLEDFRSAEIRQQAVKVLRTYPATGAVIFALISQLHREKITSIKAEIITTLGEMSAMANLIVPVLQELVKNPDIVIVRRAMVSLAKIFGNKQSIEQRKMIALQLCAELAASDSAEEKQQVVIGLRYLKVDQPEVIQTVLNLLVDNDKEVAFEAGKTLAVLQQLE